jgi:hypothetical protein
VAAKTVERGISIDEQGLLIFEVLSHFNNRYLMTLEGKELLFVA